jgi:hypothetical protein
MANAFSSCRVAYGIDASSDDLVIVRASRSRGRVNVSTEGAGARAALSSVLERIRRDVEQGRAVTAAAMPLTESFARWVSAPLPSVAKARKVFPSLLDLQLPVAVERCSCAYLDVAASDAGTVETLAVAARHEDLRARRARVAEWAVTPLLLDHEGVALWEQSLKELPLADDQHRLLIHLGADRTALTLGRKGRLMAVHGSRAAWSGSAAEVAASARALAHRIRQLLQAELGAQPGKLQWVTSGPAVRDAALQELAHALDLGPGTALITHADHAAFLARAVARRAVAGGATAINFLSGDLEPEEAVRRRDRAEQRLLVGCIAAGLALCAVNLTVLGLLHHRKESLQAEITSLAQKVSGLPRVPRGPEVKTVQRALDERDPGLQPFRDAVREPAVALLAPLVTAAAAQGVTVESLKLETAQFETSGRAPTSEACDALAEAARHVRWQTDLHREDAAGAVRFVLKGYR